jgi:TolB-like protein/Flp pilus assembly protein TadD
LALGPALADAGSRGYYLRIKTGLCGAAVEFRWNLQMMAEQKSNYRLDLGEERLWKGDEPVPVGNKAFQLLRFLVENPERLLTKNEILDAVWGDLCVSEGLVKEYIHDLRSALEDDPRHPDFIETVRGRGYRFLGGIGGVSKSPDPAAVGDVGVDLPSLAVLPFANMSGDPKQDYFADGLTEDIITELSCFRSLLVIARNSAFTYRGRAVKVQDVGRELGVRYLVEGSVRCIDSHVRVTAQLIEAASARHIWAKRYDRELEEIFALQDEITRTIVAAIEPELANVERERSRLKAPESLSAWDWYQHGLWHMYQETKEGNQNARRNFDKAIALHRDFAPAYAAAAYTLCFDIMNGYCEKKQQALEKAQDLARKAIALDDREAMAHMVLGKIDLLQCRHEESIAELETAIELNPNFADAYHGLGFTFAVSGRPEAALAQFEKAIRLSPYDPRLSSFHEMRAWALLILERDEEALDSARTAVRKPNADVWAHATLCAALGQLGKLQEAETARKELLKRMSDFSCDFVKRSVYYYKEPNQLARYLEGLIKAGLPS